MSKNSKTPVQQARYLIVQMLYAWMMSEKSPIETQADILSLNAGAHKKATIGYTTETIAAISAHATDLQKQITPYFATTQWIGLSLPVRAILLLATYEITQKPNIPTTVSIHEAVLLAKTFAETGAHKFINATLDAFAQDWQKQQASEHDTSNA